MICYRKDRLVKNEWVEKGREEKISKGKMSKVKIPNAETIETPKARRHGNECRLK